MTSSLKKRIEMLEAKRHAQNLHMATKPATGNIENFMKRMRTLKEEFARRKTLSHTENLLLARKDFEIALQKHIEAKSPATQANPYYEYSAI